MKIEVLVGVWGLPCLILVLFLFLNSSRVCLCLFPIDLTGVLKPVREVVASFSVGSGDSSSSSMP